MVVKQIKTGDFYEFRIQDLVVNKYLRAKISGDTAELENQLKSYPKLEAANVHHWELIKKLEGMGVDFKNYKYRMDN